MKRTVKLNWDEVVNTNFVFQTKPKFAVTKVVINDDDKVYAQNGSVFYEINFIQDLQEVIINTTGNQGWYMIDKETDLQYIDLVINQLYEKDYIGNDQD